MKKIFLGVAVLMFVVAMAGVAAAGTTTEDVNVSATVQAKCNAIAAGVMTFDIDPTTAAPVAPIVMTQPHVQCTKSRLLGVTVKSTNNAVMDNTGTFIGSMQHAGCTSVPYTFTYATAPSGAGFAAGVWTNFNVNGSVAVADANAADYCSGAALTDTVTMTITF